MRYQPNPSAEELQATLRELGYGVPLIVLRSWGWAQIANVNRWAQWSLRKRKLKFHPVFPQVLARFDLTIKRSLHREGGTE